MRTDALWEAIDKALADARKAVDELRAAAGLPEEGRHGRDPTRPRPKTLVQRHGLVSLTRWLGEGTPGSMAPHEYMALGGPAYFPQATPERPPRVGHWPRVKPTEAQAWIASLPVGAEGLLACTVRRTLRAFGEPPEAVELVPPRLVLRPLVSTHGPGIEALWPAFEALPMHAKAELKADLRAFCRRNGLRAPWKILGPEWTYVLETADGPEVWRAPGVPLDLNLPKP